MHISKRSGMDHTVLPANTPCLPFVRKRSSDGATSNWGKRHPIAAYYSSIDPKGWKAELPWLGHFCGSHAPTPWITRRRRFFQQLPFPWVQLKILHSHLSLSLLLLSTHVDRQGVDISFSVCFLCVCIVTDFSAEDNVSGVTFYSVFRRRPRQEITNLCELCSPKSPKSDESAAHGPRPPGCKHYRRDTHT